MWDDGHHLISRFWGRLETPRVETGESALTKGVTRCGTWILTPGWRGSDDFFLAQLRTITNEFKWFSANF